MTSIKKQISLMCLKSLKTEIRILCKKTRERRRLLFCTKLNYICGVSRIKANSISELALILLYLCEL